jgi:hypothetical protein
VFPSRAHEIIRGRERDCGTQLKRPRPVVDQGTSNPTTFGPDRHDPREVQVLKASRCQLIESNL